MSPTKRNVKANKNQYMYKQICVITTMTKTCYAYRAYNLLGCDWLINRYCFTTGQFSNRSHHLEFFCREFAQTCVCQKISDWLIFIQSYIFVLIQLSPRCCPEPTSSYINSGLFQKQTVESNNLRLSTQIHDSTHNAHTDTEICITLHYSSSVIKPRLQTSTQLTTQPTHI